jgi:hypothetical protein
MAPIHFLGFTAIAKTNYLVPNQPGYHSNKQRMLNRLVGNVEKNKLWPKKLLDVLVEFFPLVIFCILIIYPH